MSIDRVRAQLKGSIWQGIAQSGVNLSGLSSEDQSKLVESVTNSVLVSVNGVLDDAHKGQAPAPADLTDDEKVLWEGRPFLSISEFYTITSERIKVVKGVLGKDTENIELIRVQDIDVSQNLSERIFNIGDLHVSSADATNPAVILRNITAPQEVYEILRRAWMAARKKYGLQFREQM